MHAELPSSAKGLIIGLSLHLLLNFEYGRCAGSSGPMLLTGAITTKTFCVGSYHEITVEIYT